MRRFVSLGILLALLGHASLLPRAGAQSHSPPPPEGELAWKYEKNPFTNDPDTVKEGRILYRGTCVICHGSRGGRGPDLTQSGLSDLEFLRTVMEGRAGTQMPAWRNKLNEEDVWKILIFLGRG